MVTSLLSLFDVPVKALPACTRVAETAGAERAIVPNVASPKEIANEVSVFFMMVLLMMCE